eukprot:1783109-Rhodomonas_salina.1
MIEDSDSEPRRLPREEDGRRSRRRRALEHRSQPHFNRSRCQCPESETHRSGQRIGHVILAKERDSEAADRHRKGRAPEACMSKPRLASTLTRPPSRAPLSELPGFHCQARLRLTPDVHEHVTPACRRPGGPCHGAMGPTAGPGAGYAQAGLLQRTVSEGRIRHGGPRLTRSLRLCRSADMARQSARKPASTDLEQKPSRGCCELSSSTVTAQPEHPTLQVQA